MKQFLLCFLILSQLGCYTQSDFDDPSTEKLSPPKVTQKKIEPFESEQHLPNEVETLARNQFSSKVVAIQDGDTVELRLVYTGKEARQRQNKNICIRFAHIDTPERGKPFYKVATQFTADYCFGEVVTIVHDNEFDRYGRLIGEVFLPDGKNLNKMLVQAGLAVHFKKYSDSEEYAQLEIIAQKERRGIWGN